MMSDKKNGQTSLWAYSDYLLLVQLQVISLPLMSTDMSDTKTAWMGSMRSKHYYDVELNFTMGEDRLGSTSTEGPL